MSDRYFLDTNILVYSFDYSEPRKRQIAEDMVTEALRDGNGLISFQVIGEFLSVLTRKFEEAMSTADLREYMHTVLFPLCRVQSSQDLYDHCLFLHEQTGYSIFDSLMLASAMDAGCSKLYTEDLQHGRQIGGVEIVDPFVT